MWQQPRTIKLYLHPPLANRQVTIWPDFKIVNKVVVPPSEAERDDYGLRFLFGEPLHAPEWLISRWQVRPDGCPMPVLSTVYDDIELTLEAFCDIALSPVTYIRLRLHNPSPAARKLRLGIMLRSGLDRLLIGMDGDYYAAYQPRLGHWDLIKSTWRLDGMRVTDGLHEARLHLPEGATAVWQTREPGNHLAKNLIASSIPVSGCSEAEVYITLGKPAPEPDACSFEEARRSAERFWLNELGQIARKPAVPRNLEPMVNHLVSQCLQMLVTTTSGDVWPRQGGRYDGVWPVEAMEWLVALDHIGLHAWSERGYAFFRQHQIHEGEDAGRFTGQNSPRWQNETGGVLYGLGRHLAYRKDPSVLAAWRQPIVDAVNYIERQRAQTRATPEAPGYGLMPPGLGHDWQYKGQYWCFSDSIIFMGLSSVAAAFTQLGDPAADRLNAITADYLACMRATLRSIVESQPERDEVYIPNVLGVEEQYPPFGPYCVDGPSNLVRAGIIDPCSRLFERLERFWRNRDWMQHGLTAPMNECLMTQGYFADPWAGCTWYTNFADLHWFKAWLARDERDKAAETLWAQFRYGMTAEYYMLERYAANDPTFCPWQPNASANGRTIEMLFEYYGQA